MTYTECPQCHCFIFRKIEDIVIPRKKGNYIAKFKNCGKRDKFDSPDYTIMRKNFIRLKISKGEVE
jgi:hypothetical protein